jgi:mRNA interferase RelE/StbE
MYKIILERQALHSSRRFPKDIQELIARKIATLSENPRQLGSKKLAGSLEPYWRVRVGDYRIVYLIDDVEK